MQAENTNKPHVHAELIKQWADGAKIQLWDSVREKWEDICDPKWSISYKYRVKPKQNIKTNKMYMAIQRGQIYTTYSSKLYDNSATIEIKYDSDTGKILDIKIVE